jgi:hypothetical protein
MALPTQSGQGVDLFQSLVAEAMCVVIPVLALFPDLTGFE